MLNAEWWMLTLSSLSDSHTLTVSMVDSFMNVEWGRMTASPSQTENSVLLYRKRHEERLPIRTEISALLYRIRHDWTVPHPSRGLCIATSKKERLNRSSSKTGSLHCILEKDKPEPQTRKLEHKHSVTSILALFSLHLQPDNFYPFYRRVSPYLGKNKTEPQTWKFDGALLCAWP